MSEHWFVQAWHWSDAHREWLAGVEVFPSEVSAKAHVAFHTAMYPNTTKRRCITGPHDLGDPPMKGIWKDPYGDERRIAMAIDKAKAVYQTETRGGLGSLP